MIVARPITAGPMFHWFGYYDKLQFDPTNRYVLGMEVDFESRQPEADDEIGLGVIDLEDGDSWREIGRTRSWCWQQGCMLQWIPGSGPEVIWNDREGDQFVAHILDVITGEKRTIRSPIYTLSPDGSTGFTADFGRTNDMRPGYGYAGVPDRAFDDNRPDDSGIWRVDLQSGETELILSLDQVANVPWPHGDFSGHKHYFNHLLASPDGSRLEFLHRWRTPHGVMMGGPLRTRMFTCRADGSDLKIVCDSGQASHFIWRDPDHILVCCSDAGERQMCLINVHSRDLEIVPPGGLRERDGHFSYLPHRNNEWLLNDGGGQHSPGGADRELMLYHVPTRAVVPLWSYRLSGAYVDDRRVDLHPRFSSDGTKVVVDAAVDHGRQLYLIDITGLTK